MPNSVGDTAGAFDTLTEIKRTRAPMTTRFDAIVFSSLWASCAAAALTGAAMSALGLSLRYPPMALAFVGTLVVYNIDRLRDLELDRVTSPSRSAWVAAHHRALGLLVAAAGIASLFLAIQLGLGAILLCGACAVPGLLHRRLKNHNGVKIVSVAGTWVIVTVGLAILGASRPASSGLLALPLLSVVGIYATTLIANVIASSLRETVRGEHASGNNPSLWAARGFCGLGIVLAAVAGGTVLPLIALPVAQAAALLRFPASERDELWLVDGALVVGPSLAILLAG